MKKLAFVLAILSVLIGPFNLPGESAFAHDHEDCACCAQNQCHAKTKCHDTASAKACVCSYQPAKIFMPRSFRLPTLVSLGTLTPTGASMYRFVTEKDIFHPPKIA